ncbi:hypothetical protein [Nocardia sp. NBC_01329]|uniref:hypothetical protein n=1 Tax=Nocardia sp. NBC_01329 TaxID=2903594 RepID=UPI002E13818C|nr:hypothetical protein OG405_16095 [Nocardia sp. NBC_01329]
MSPWKFLSCPILAGLLLASMSCGASAEPPTSPVTAELGTPFTLSAGVVASLDDDRMIASFAGIPADSRCPAATACVWEGDATVVIEVSVGGQRSRPELHTSRRFGTGANVNDYRIELVALRPARPPSGTIPVGDYRVDLLITKA